jgi:hypothetical protein
MDKEAGSIRTIELFMHEQLTTITWYWGDDKVRKSGNLSLNLFV